MNELEATRSPNPIFTALVQEQNAEHQARLMYAQVEVGHPVARSVQADVVHDPAPDDRFPFRASRSITAGGVVGPMFSRSVLAEHARQVASEHQAERDAAATPVVVEGLISMTPTGSIDLNLRRQVEK